MEGNTDMGTNSSNPVPCLSTSRTCYAIGRTRNKTLECVRCGVRQSIKGWKEDGYIVTMKNETKIAYAMEPNNV